MGRASIRPISALEFFVLIPHIAHILQELHESKLSPLPFKYGFEISFRAKAEVQAHIHHFRRELPTNVAFYEIEGQSLFDIRGASGGICTSYICYLYTKE